MNIFPAILSENLQEAQQQLDVAIEAEAEIVQLDVIDGIYADACTLTPADFIALNFQDCKADIHLMTIEPMDYVHECIDFQVGIPVRAIIGQVERMTSQQHFIEEIKHQDWLVGLSLDLDTPLEAIDEDSWDQLDIIQLMAIRAGSQGQDFHPYVMTKLAELTSILTQRDISLEIIVDGGIKQEQVNQLADLGYVTGVAVGSLIWTSSDPVATLKRL